MGWIFYSFIYAIFNAIYMQYNEKHHYNGYLLGIIRGFGISFMVLPFYFFLNIKLSFLYFAILILQGIMIGIYDSHIFFASSKFGSRSTFGFMATSVFVTLVLWWGIEFKDLANLLEKKSSLLSLIFILMGVSISYWEMMRVHINSDAEKYLYPAVFSLALMSIATRYIALNSPKMYEGLICYLSISCFVSGIYNLVMFIFFNTSNKMQNLERPSVRSMGWLVLFSFILICAKTIALRIASNPVFVVAMLLLSPLISEILKKGKLKASIEMLCFLFFVMLLIMFSFNLQ